jgi:hypothetical protein
MFGFEGAGQQRLQGGEHVVPDNLDAFRPEVILGSSKRFATFGTLEELLLAVLREQQVL